MAGGAVVSGSSDKFYPGKMTLNVFFTCVIAATGGLIFGYDIGISGISQKQYLFSSHSFLFTAVED